jgi:serine/threonine protein kinase
VTGALNEDLARFFFK